MGPGAERSGPGGEEAADENELAQVVGVMVGEKQGFVEQRLVIGVGNGSEKVGGRVFNFGGELFAVGAEGRDTFIPGFCVGRLRRFGPIAGGEIGRDMLGIECVFDDVPLGDAEMFEEFPGRVQSAFGAFAAEIRGKVLHGGVKGGVSVFAGEESEKISAEGLEMVAHGPAPFGKDGRPGRRTGKWPCRQKVL
jgi:hypothetical protein